MDKVRFVYWNKIYSISEVDNVICIFDKDGDCIIKTTAAKLETYKASFGKLAYAVYKTMILGK